MRDFPTISSIGKEGKKVDPDVPKDDDPNRRCFYALRSKGENPNEHECVGYELWFSIYILP